MVLWFCDSSFRDGAFSTVINTAVWKSTWAWKPGNCWDMEPCGVRAWWVAMLLSKYDSSCNWGRCLADLTLNCKCHHVSSGLEDVSSSLKSCSASSGLNVGVRWQEILKPNVNSDCRPWEQTGIAGPTSGVSLKGNCVCSLPSLPLCFHDMKWHALEKTRDFRSATSWKWEEKQCEKEKREAAFVGLHAPWWGCLLCYCCTDWAVL